MALSSQAIDGRSPFDERPEDEKSAMDGGAMSTVWGKSFLAITEDERLENAATSLGSPVTCWRSSVGVQKKAS